MQTLLEKLRGGLIVSCRPDATDCEHDPMNAPAMMAALARGGPRRRRGDSRR